MNFIEIMNNILIYMFAIIAFLIIIFLVIILPILIIIDSVPKKKWYKITYEYEFLTNFYCTKAKNPKAAEINFRTKSRFGNSPIYAIDEIKVE